jgi:hypothetical protein
MALVRFRTWSTETDGQAARLSFSLFSPTGSHRFCGRPEILLPLCDGVSADSFVTRSTNRLTACIPLEQTQSLTMRSEHVWLEYLKHELFFPHATR